MDWKQQLLNVRNGGFITPVVAEIKESIELAHLSGQRIGKQVERERIKGVVRGRIDQRAKPMSSEAERNAALKALLEAIEGEGE